MALVLDTSHPAYPYIQEVWPFKEGTGTPASFIGAAGVTTDAGSFTWTLEGSGYGITLTTADAIGLGADIFPTAPDVTFVIRKRKTDTTNRDACAFGYAGDTGGTSRRAGGMFPDSDGSANGTPNNTVIFDFGGTTSEVSRKIISSLAFDTTLDTWVIRVNASEIRFWRNGTDIAHTTGGAPPTRVNTGANGRLNRGFNQSAGDNMFVDLFALYSGALTDAMCASLSSDPWAMFLNPNIATSMSIDVAMAPTLTVPIVLGTTAAIGVSMTADLLLPFSFHADIDVALTANLLVIPSLAASAAIDVTMAADLQTMPFPRVLTVLCPVSGLDQFTTGRLVALVEVEARTGPVQPVLTVLVPVGLSQASSGFTMTVLALGRDGDDNPVTDARSRRILVPVGLDEVS